MGEKWLDENILVGGGERGGEEEGGKGGGVGGAQVGGAGGGGGEEGGMEYECEVCGLRFREVRAPHLLP
jgi:hypothetical protein